MQDNGGAEKNGQHEDAHLRVRVCVRARIIQTHETRARTITHTDVHSCTHTHTHTHTHSTKMHTSEASNAQGIMGMWSRTRSGKGGYFSISGTRSWTKVMTPALVKITPPQNTSERPSLSTADGIGSCGARSAPTASWK